MKWLFDSEGPFISGLSRIFDVMFLALLTFVCCIPIVTAGAAISAMYDIMIKMVLDRDHGVFKPYFAALAAILSRLATISSFPEEIIVAILL